MIDFMDVLRFGKSPEERFEEAFRMFDEHLTALIDELDTEDLKK
jgi:Ca2+-binding EF-hand superfamily protein